MTRFWRVQPKGAKLFGHKSGLAYEKQEGIFAFEDPLLLFDTYTWIKVKKNLDAYEMVVFEGRVLARPEDSEGIVVHPLRERSRMPMRRWLETIG